MEDQYGVGDVVDAGPATGTVEGVGLRTTHLRDVNGTLWHIPNGEIRRVGNLYQGWARALVDVEVAYSTDLDAATRTIERVAQELDADDQWAPKLLEQPEVWGVEEELGPDSVRVRLVAKTRPLEQWKVAREARARLKVAFDQAGIEVSAQRPHRRQRRPGRAGRLTVRSPPPARRRRFPGVLYSRSVPCPARWVLRKQVEPWPIRMCSRWSSPAARASGWRRSRPTGPSRRSPSAAATG